MGLFAAPELMSLATSSRLYTFVQYSGYAGPADSRAPRPFADLAGRPARNRRGRRRGRHAALASRARRLRDGARLRGGHALLHRRLARPRPRAATGSDAPDAVSAAVDVYLAAVAVWAICSFAAQRIGPAALGGIRDRGRGRIAPRLAGRPGLTGVSRPRRSSDPGARALFGGHSASRNRRRSKPRCGRPTPAAPPGTTILVLGTALWHRADSGRRSGRRGRCFSTIGSGIGNPTIIGTPGYQPTLATAIPTRFEHVGSGLPAASGIGAVVATGQAAVAAIWRRSGAVGRRRIRRLAGAAADDRRHARRRERRRVDRRRIDRGVRDERRRRSDHSAQLVSPLDRDGQRGAGPRSSTRPTTT